MFSFIDCCVACFADCNIKPVRVLKFITIACGSQGGIKNIKENSCVAKFVSPVSRSKANRSGGYGYNESWRLELFTWEENVTTLSGTSCLIILGFYLNVLISISSHDAPSWAIFWSWGLHVPIHLLVLCWSHC